MQLSSARRGGRCSAPPLQGAAWPIRDSSARHKKQAEETRGQGDAEAQRIIADAAGQNPDLYLFLRTLEFYKENLPETPVFLKPGEGILRYLKGAE
jgi:membrane protease subunit HflC